MTNETDNKSTAKRIIQDAWPYLITHPVAAAITLESASRFDNANKKLEGITGEDILTDSWRTAFLQKEASPENLVTDALTGYALQLAATPIITYCLTGSPRAAAASLVAQIGATIASGYASYRKVKVENQ